MKYGLKVMNGLVHCAMHFWFRAQMDIFKVLMYCGTANLHVIDHEFRGKLAPPLRLVHLLVKLGLKWWTGGRERL